MYVQVYASSKRKELETFQIKTYNLPYLFLKIITKNAKLALVYFSVLSLPSHSHILAAPRMVP